MDVTDLPIVTRILDTYDQSILWIVIVGFIVSFILAFGLGANDAANSFGTAVGAKVFTLLQAIILASIFETLGSILLGANVSGTIRGGLFDASIYDGREELLMVGQLSALGSACTWLLIATAMRFPVSASHSIVGASLGFHLVVFLDQGVEWLVIGRIAISWVASPFLSGIVSSVIFFILKFTMLDRENQLKWGLRTVPFWYFIVFFINGISICLGITQLRETSLGVWLVILVALGAGLFVGFAALVFLVPYTRRKARAAQAQLDQEQAEEGEGNQTVQAREGDIELKGVTEVHEKYVSTEDEQGTDASDDGKTRRASTAQDNVEEADITPDTNGEITNKCVVVCECQEPPQYDEVRAGRSASRVSRVSRVSRATTVDDDEDKKEGVFNVDKKSEDWLSVKDTLAVTIMCAPLQGLSACFAAFSHGGNDVSNAIGPLIGLYLIYQEGRIDTEQTTPIWILVYGGVGISVGLAILGRRVIKTIGTDLTPMTPSTGFAINLGAAITVLIASNLSIPVSTTHCLVGSVAFVGFIRARKAMDLKLFTGIISAWIITLPATVLLSAAFMGLLQHAVPGGCNIQPLRYADPTNATLLNFTTSATS